MWGHIGEDTIIMAKDDPTKIIEAGAGDDQDEIWPLETDSVDAQFGGEYSEDTLRMVRGYPKPTWLEEPSVGFASVKDHGPWLQL